MVRYRLSWRDQVSIACSAFVLFIGWSTESIHSVILQTEWYADFGSLHYDASITTSTSSQSSFGNAATQTFYNSPIVADLDGDKQFEVVVASMDPPELAAMHAPKMNRQMSKTRPGKTSYRMHGKRNRILKTTATPIGVSKRVSKRFGPIESILAELVELGITSWAVED